ncbi:hypothetical protein A2866_05315 [Candidatus Roizmanbacteria bacterium RIFCSPHIGHO2_01_FULL_39_8]|uniref:Methyltransferase type 11 domain-containing protein n=3 Tax=Candidatus Roizmaniibacteriota TaxID=1752723 RepID=A0A1F7GTT2_9BACT|nr:MAG: hypothetical protein A2866_05315 [Candidatus Roizmanbacteria bacterium RIFCSPHIGHO2_01_FULL_39_8]OGK25556.1 MAG: hypothetical protein A3C28_01725 [Candidatus Roizmanbacteria bacterium RIFCSPHIGHO2_02_FULL_39_9]OGK34932.1 MAG: hypothetical protein A3F60_04800 [Candidatus Roizmanbacteria bacterium RIFCSPHIGHO2_12_FULL_39_8]
MRLQKIDSSFSSFEPRDYLNEYYSRIGTENETLLRFFNSSYKKAEKNGLMLEFSGGPTIYPLISAAPVMKEIHFADFLDKNLLEVQKWQNRSVEAFDWTIFFRKALEIEGKINVKKNDIYKRESLLRSKLTKFLHCDAFDQNPLGKNYRQIYDLLNVNFVPDSVAKSKEVWKKLIKNICSLIKPRGLLVMSALKDATYWKAGSKFFPAVHIDEDDLKRLLKSLYFKILTLFTIPAEVVDEKAENFEGYKGMIFLTAKKEFDF